MVDTNSKHTQEQWEGEWFITTVSLTVSGLLDVRHFFRSHLQKTKIFWNACMRKKQQQTKTKRAAGMRCGTMCLRGMQHSLRHVFVRRAVCCMHAEAVAQHPCVGTTAVVLKAEAQIGPVRPHADAVGLKRNKAHTLASWVSRSERRLKRYDWSKDYQDQLIKFSFSYFEFKRVCIYRSAFFQSKL